MQRLAIRFVSLLGLFLLHSPAGAQEARWIRVASPHLEMYTTAQAEIAAEALTELEGLLLYFRSAAASATVPARLRIVAFSSGWEYQQFRLNSYSPAYFVGGPEQGTIVLGRLAKLNFPALRHEYVHALARACGWRLPLWLSEGLADQLAGVDASRVRYRVNLMRRQGVMPLDELTAVSRPYEDPGAALRFYASSWALTNLLLVESPYREALWSLLRSGGADLGAILAASGRTEVELARDLAGHVGRLKAVGPSRGTTPVRVECVTSPAEGVMVGLALVRLQADAGDWTGARARLGELADAGRNEAEWWALTGDLAWRESSVDAAREAYEKAMVLGTDNVAVLMRLARLERGRAQAGRVQARLAALGELAEEKEAGALEPAAVVLSTR